ncbi:hypothetical protein FRB97_001495 [Tulasnella sp. 331]|nr:hypothetical protein FRB97_001495 [Tulasnella sp. 331]
MEAYHVSTTDPWILENWWGWRWSWICLGGPPGRYLTAVVFGYRELQRERARNGPMDIELGSMVREPSLSLLFLVLMGLVLAWFTIALAVGTLYDVGRGLTSVDTMRQAGLRDGQIPPRLVWIPSSLNPPTTPELDETLATPLVPRGACCEVFPEERPYDLGWRKNLTALWEPEPMISSHGTFKDLAILPILNPDMLRRMRASLGPVEQS